MRHTVLYQHMPLLYVFIRKTILKKLLLLAANPPTNATGSQIYETWAKLRWSTDSYSSNMCEITEFYVECEALSSENEDKEWIIPNSDVRLNVSDSSARPTITTNITDLSEFTNYTCYGVVINTGGESNQSEPVRFQTGEGGKLKLCTL